MELTLTWDLFILVFFLIIVSYSVMIGKEQTIKVILSSYIAILASDAVGNIVASIIGQSGTVSSVLVIPSESKAVIMIKIAVFVILTVALTTRGAFDILIADEKSPFMRMMMVASYGILFCRTDHLYNIGLCFGGIASFFWEFVYTKPNSRNRRRKPTRKAYGRKLRHLVFLASHCICHLESFWKRHLRT
jgi:hypothetical protein